jgi:hypothetical protein
LQKCNIVKNVTICVDDEIYRQARIKAAEQNTTVSALVKNYLVRLTAGKDANRESEFGCLAAQEQEMRQRLFAAAKGLQSSDNVSRETLHDRDTLR